MQTSFIDGALALPSYCCTFAVAAPRPKIDGRVFNRRFDTVKARADNGPAPRNQMGVSCYISHRKWARQILSLKNDGSIDKKFGSGTIFEAELLPLFPNSVWPKS